MASAAPPPGEESVDAAGIDEAALYAVVRRAVEDALLGVIGTVLLVGVAVVLVLVGVAIALGAGLGRPLVALLGVVIGLVGLYVGASTLDLLPQR